MALTVTCAQCRGTGRAALTGSALETWHALRKCPEPISGSALAVKAGLRTTAMCNRLVDLERLGLARGVRHGRERLWVALNPRR